MLRRLTGHFWRPSFYRALAYEEHAGIAFLAKFWLWILLPFLALYLCFAIPEFIGLTSAMPILEVQDGRAAMVDARPYRLIVSGGTVQHLPESMIFDTARPEPLAVAEWMQHNNVVLMFTGQHVYYLGKHEIGLKSWTVEEFFGRTRHVDADVYRLVLGKWAALFCVAGLLFLFAVLWLASIVLTLGLTVLGLMLQMVLGTQLTFRDHLRLATHAFLPAVPTAIIIGLLTSFGIGIMAFGPILFFSYMLAILYVRTE